MGKVNVLGWVIRPTYIFETSNKINRAQGDFLSKIYKSFSISCEAIYHLTSTNTSVSFEILQVIPCKNKSKYFVLKNKCNGLIRGKVYHNYHSTHKNGSLHEMVNSGNYETIYVEIIKQNNCVKNSKI